MTSPRESLPKRADLERLQNAKLLSLLDLVRTENPFYGPSLRTAGYPTDGRARGVTLTLREFTERVPLTTKTQLVEDHQRHPPFGSNLSYPVSRYTRYNQTSGTKGQVLRWLDTPESWGAMLRNWETVFEAAGVGAGDRVFFAFSFGPFLGFWTAFGAAEARGLSLRPGRRHEQSSAARNLVGDWLPGDLLHTDVRAAIGRSRGGGGHRPEYWSRQGPPRRRRARRQLTRDAGTDWRRCGRRRGSLTITA